MPHATTETSAHTPLSPVSSGYADVNGIKLYHEIYGQGAPLVLLHGGLMTIGEMSRPLEFLAKTHQVIAVELQGHGRTGGHRPPPVVRDTGRRHCRACSITSTLLRPTSSACRSAPRSVCARLSSIRKRSAG